MRSPWGNPREIEREIGGQFRPGKDKIVTRYFGVMARAVWPIKTAAQVAAICDCDERQAKRYLAGEYPIPYVMQRHMDDLMLGFVDL